MQVTQGETGSDAVLCQDYQEELMFERLRDAINAALDAATGPPDSREVLSGMRDAVIEARAALEGMKQGVVKTEQRLILERRQLEDAERRGRMAGEIDDQETVDVAELFTAKHRERVEVLQDKLEAQRAELALAERELAEMKGQLKKAAGSSHAETAWREIEAAGGVRPETDVGDELLRSQMDRAAREAEAEAKLDALKKKMGR
jgi:ABC-type phosphate transport system auxiliary subunit